MSRRQYSLAISIFVGMLAVSVEAKELIIQDGTLLDGVRDITQHKMSVVIQDDKVERVEPGYTDIPGVEVVDLSHVTVMPASSIATCIFRRICRAAPTQPRIG